MSEADPVSRAITLLAERRDLPASLSSQAFAQVMAGEASPVQTAALLVALRVKGESAAELEGAVLALRAAMVRVPAGAPETLVDTCGTGGGAVGTFNISTAAAFVAAGAGARVVKHGNRSFTSRSGSADVLEALGVAIELEAARAAAVLERCGMTFLFAPRFHPAMRHAGPVRRELGLTTIMNLVGPLSNPAGAARQLVGAADPARARLLADTLCLLGAQRALVVHAGIGMDEVAPPGAGATEVHQVEGGRVKTWALDPEGFGLAAGGVAELAGGSPEDNARIVAAILEGRDRSVRRSAVVINAAAALVAAGLCDEWEAAVARANGALDSGAAAGVLERLRTATRG